MKTNKKVIILEEGTGDNLLWEDKKNGYNDYLNYYILNDFEDVKTYLIGDATELDGGMWLFNNLAHPYESVNELIELFMEENQFDPEIYRVVVG